MNPNRPKWKSLGPVFLVALGILAVLLVIVGIKALQIRAMVASGKAGGPPPESVAAAEVLQKDWQPVLRAVGSISPVQGAMLSAELPGIVAEIAFVNGADVKQGDVIARLASAQEEAQLRAAAAEAELAKSDRDRARDLRARNVTSQAELDTAEAKYKQQTAAVDNMKGRMEKLTIRAPFNGKAGIRLINVGQTVNAGQPIVALQAIDPVYADFTLPQQRLSDLREGLDVVVRTDAYPDRQFEGKLTALNSMIDPVTRNVTLQATLANPEHLLKPGMFAKVEVLLPQKNPTLVIPATAVSYAPFGDSVYVIENKPDPKTNKETTTVRQQFIRIGETRGDFVGVTTGLKPGEKVVSAGVFKLRNGMAVQIKEDVAPKPEENPRPADA